MDENKMTDVMDENMISEETGALSAVDKQQIRKRTGHVFKWLLLYNMLIMIFAGVLTALKVPLGVESIGGTLLGVGALFLITRRKYPVKVFEKSEKKMTGKDFLLFFSLMALLQVITFATMELLDALGVQGTSLDVEMDTLFFFIYVSFTGPFCEEMVYRGFSCGKLKAIGKIPAIVFSALAFGLMHANANQFVVGALTGMLFGFIFVEYSIWWPLLLHVINNCVLSALPEVLFADVLSVRTLNAITYSVLGVFALYGIITLIRRRGEAAAWLKDPANRAPKGAVGAALKSFWFWLFVIAYVAFIALMMIFPQYFAAFSGASMSEPLGEAAVKLLPLA